MSGCGDEVGVGEWIFGVLSVFLVLGSGIWAVVRDMWVIWNWFGCCGF
jgi:hypothetical protein